MEYKLLTDKEVNILIKNITEAYLLKDNNLLTSKTIDWIYNNSILLPQHVSNRNNNYPAKHKHNFAWLKTFLTDLNLFHFISCDYALYHQLTNINSWIQKNYELSIHSLLIFKQLCHIINKLRIQLNIKQYTIHYSISDWQNKKKRYIKRISAFDLNQAAKELKKSCGNGYKWEYSYMNKYTGKIHSIRQLNDIPLFMIYKTQVCNIVWNELTK